MKLSVQLEPGENVLNECKIADEVLHLCNSADVDPVAVAKMLIIQEECDAVRRQRDISSRQMEESSR